jgi:metal-responsive CopG/Arc/MetJ family transcriptional regulator
MEATDMGRISVQMTVSLSPQLYRKAMSLAKDELRNKSELVREALRDYIARKEGVLAARNRLATRLGKQGIRNLSDLERLIDEERS